MTTLALLLLSTIPHETVVRESVDLIEANRLYDDNGRLVFEQQIFWDWKGDHFEVRDWRLVKQESQHPVRDFATGGWCVLWQDGETMRRVDCKATRETWTQYDPELVAREKFPKEFRRELRGK
jgi:hypothetical protein